MSTLSIQPYNSIYNIGDCIEFKCFTQSNIPDSFEYIICNGKIIGNIDPDLLEVQVYDYTKKDFTGGISWVNPVSISKHYPKEKIPQLTPRIILKDIWKDLVFREIKTVKVKDQQFITYDYINDAGFIRTEQYLSIESAIRYIDPNKENNIYTHYKDYFGFTTYQSLRNNDIYSNQEIFFSRKCYCELNLSGRSITGNFSLRRGFKSIPPHKKQYICGLVETGEKGLFYRKWFICSKEFLTLWTMICESDHYSLKNKTEEGYITKSLDELMQELNTRDYCLAFDGNIDISDLKEKYHSYNIETVALYIPNIYQIIALSLFKTSKSNIPDIYPTYEDRLRTDLVWMKK